MKILYIVSTLVNSGPTNQLFNILSHLNQKLFTPHVLTLSPEPENSLLQEFKSIGINISSLGLSRIAGMLLGPRLLKEHVKKIDPDIIHSQGIRADGLIAKYLNDYIRMATVRNYPYHDYPMKFGKIKGTMMACHHIVSLKKIDRLVACSNSIKNIIENKHNIRLEAIQNGVDTKKFVNISDKEKMFLRKKLKMPLDKKVFISVGSLVLRKDPITVVKSFLNSRVSQSGRAVLYMLGEGPLLMDCKALNEKGLIFFTGYVHNVVEYLQASDFFISASLSEGLPNTVIEALATGLPVCLSDIEQHSEILNYDENAGLLAKVKSVKSFSSMIDQILDRDYKTLRQSALDIAHKNLSASVMSNQYQKLYKELMGSSL